MADKAKAAEAKAKGNTEFQAVDEWWWRRFNKNSHNLVLWIAFSSKTLVDVVWYKI